MRPSKQLILVAFAAGGFLLTATGADAGGLKSKMKSMFKKAPKPVVVRPASPAPVYVPRPIAPRPVFVPRPVVPTPVFVPTPVVAVPVHTHAYQTVHEQVWVPPVYSTVVVGYDFFGRPVHQQTMTTAGYYRTVSVLACSCGHRQSP